MLNIELFLMRRLPLLESEGVVGPALEKGRTEGMSRNRPGPGDVDPGAQFSSK